jgi:hypothetical protein
VSLEGVPLPAWVAGVVMMFWLGGYYKTASVIVVVGVVAYLIDCARNPWVPCGGCNETGRQWSWWTQTFRTCRRCSGFRKRVRFGRRLWTKSTDINEDRK